MQLTISPIGYVRSSCKEPADLPKAGTPSVEAVLEIDEKYAEGLADVAVGDRLMVLFYFHLSKEAKLTVPLMGVGPMVGVFSSHSPTRPNFIGATNVTVESIDGTKLHVIGADMLDGTPVLDLKPTPTKSEH